MEEKCFKDASNPEREPKSGANLSRRRFFKAGAIGATLGAAALLGDKKAVAAEAAQASVTREHDEFPLKVLDTYKQFPQRNTAFSRGVLGEPGPLKSLQGYVGPDHALMGEGPRDVFDKYGPGWTPVEKALDRASWAVNDLAAEGSQFGVASVGAYTWEAHTSSVKHKFKSKKEASKMIKKAAKTLGASLVGITPYDQRWTYDPLFNALEKKEYPAEFPFEPKSVIVIAIEMDYKQVETAPSWIADTGFGKGYSDMAAVGWSVATFLRNLGHRCFASGNDTSLSVPYGVAAGLGEAGRNGILVTYEYGPRVRLCKVFTEMDLEYDKPKTFGVREFCERCQRCADACPGKAIPKDEKPSFKIANKSSNPGVEKWAVDGVKCFKYWGESNAACGTCIAACPYNKPDFWHHKMVVWATRAAPGPLHSLMREMDIVFGYGNTFDKKALLQWWDK